MKRLDRSDFANLEGTPGQRWRIIRDSIRGDVQSMFDSGHSANSIAKSLGVSRSMINTCFDELGIVRPGVSEGNRRQAAMASPDARIARAKAAHAAIRMIGRSQATQAKHAAREQKSLRYMGVCERDFTEKVAALGYHCVPQLAMCGYNIDIAVGHVAVEIHSVKVRPHNITQRLERIVKLINAGMSVFYICVSPDWDVVPKAAIQQFVAFHDMTRGLPAGLCQYRVVRRNGEIDWSCERELKEIANVFATHHALNASKPDP